MAATSGHASRSGTDGQSPASVADHWGCLKNNAPMKPSATTASIAATPASNTRSPRERSAQSSTMATTPTTMLPAHNGSPNSR